MITDVDITKLKTVFATKDEIKNSASKDDLKKFATKDDLKNFATKKDLERFATKDDLKNFATKKDLEQFATKKDMKELDSKFDKLADYVIGHEQKIDTLQVDVAEIKDKMSILDDIYNMLDRDNKAVDTNKMEITAAHHKLNRHEGWIHTIAQESRITLQV